MATHSSILAWRIPGTEEPSGLPSMGLHRVGHNWINLAAAAVAAMKGKGSHSVVSDSSRPHGLQPTRLLCPWDSPGKNTGVGCHCLRFMVKSPEVILRQKSNIKPRIKSMQHNTLPIPWKFHVNSKFLVLTENTILIICKSNRLFNKFYNAKRIIFALYWLYCHNKPC